MKGDDIIQIKIIGVNSVKGIKQKRILKQACEEIEEEIKIIELNPKNKYYDIKNLPTLIINNNIVSEGKILSIKEIKSLLLSYQINYI